MWINRFIYRSAFQITAILDSYESSEMLKYKCAKEILHGVKVPRETVDHYYSHLCKLGRQLGADTKMLQYLMMDGFHRQIATYVIQ